MHWSDDEDTTAASQYQCHLDCEHARANEQAAPNSLYILIELGVILREDALDENGYLNRNLGARVVEIVSNHVALQRKVDALTARLAAIHANDNASSEPLLLNFP